MGNVTNGTAPVASGNKHFVQVQNLTKRYVSREGDVLALDNVGFDVGEGEFHSIVGPSGCGKSTMLMIVAGLTPATSGSVVIQNEPVTRPVTDLGIVFQRDVLLDWRTVMGNVMLQIEMRGRDSRLYQQRAKELLSTAGLIGFENSFPWQLSGGMRQRVAICRALIHDAPLLLMDEPFGALDAITRDQMNLVLQDMWNENRKTALFITHSISEAIFLSDRVYVMSPRPGRIVETIDVDLPRPRHLNTRETPEFGRYVARIRTIFEATGVLQER